MAAIDADERQAARQPARQSWNWRSLLPRVFPRVAVASAVLLFSGLSIRHYEIASRHYTLAKEVAMATSSQPIPSIDALENLDAIHRMSQSSHADGELPGRLVAMNRPYQFRFYQLISGLALFATALATFAQPSSPALPKTTAAANHVAIQVPMPPAPQSPVIFFRQLLAMTPPQRMLSLTNRTPRGPCPHPRQGPRISGPRSG